MSKEEINIPSAVFSHPAEYHTNSRFWIEFLTIAILISATGFYLWGQEIEAVEVVLFFLLGFASWTDIKYGIIPNTFIGVGVLTAVIFFFEGQLIWVESLLSAIGLCVAFLLIRWLSKIFFNKPGLGMGDIKLFSVLGLLLGHNVLWVTYLSFMLAGFFAIAALALGNISRKDHIPLAPFIAIAFLLNGYLIPWDIFLGWWL